MIEDDECPGVQAMYQRLHQDSHLKHNGRLQLGLFLKVSTP